MKKIPVTPLTPDAFRPYGRAVMQQDSPPDIQNDFIDYWHDVADLANLGTLGLTGFMRVKQNPPVLRTLQKLHKSIEVYFTLDGNSSLEFVALPGADGKPDLATLACFSLTGGQSIVVGEGVWHCTPFALSDKVDFALILHNDVIVRNADRTLSVDPATIEYFTLAEEITIENTTIPPREAGRLPSAAL